MNLLETLLKAGDGKNGIAEQIANNFELSSDQANSALSSLLPAISRSIQKNMKEGGLQSLLAALNKGSHQRYLDEPETLKKQEAIDDGNAILGHLFGSKDVSRNTAAHAAEQTGIGADILKKILPMVAAAAMGGLSKQTSEKGLLSSAVEQENTDSSGASDMLTAFLDADKDGSIVDDVLSMAKRLF